MYTIKKLNKTYGKRRIKVFDGKKLVGEISEFWHWISFSNPENHDILRRIAMENLWWLLHTDNLNEDVTEEEAWKEKVDKWNQGRIYGTTGLGNEPTSNFFPGEYEIALNSINNK